MPLFPASGLLWNDYWFHSDAVVILVFGKSTGFLFLALRVRLFHRCIRPEFGAKWWLARLIVLGVSVEVVCYGSYSLCVYPSHFTPLFPPSARRLTRIQLPLATQDNRREHLQSYVKRGCEGAFAPMAATHSIKGSLPRRRVKPWAISVPGQRPAQNGQAKNFRSESRLLAQARKRPCCQHSNLKIITSRQC
jgi:hypothetical protein